MNRFIRGLFSVLAAMAIGLSPAFALDVNKASLEELQTIKGVGPVIGERIIAERKKGAFKSDDDLKARVQGVGDVVAENIRKGVVKASGDKGKSAGAAAGKGERAKGKVTEVRAANEKAVAGAANAKDAKTAKSTKAAKPESTAKADKAAKAAKPEKPAKPASDKRSERK